MTAPSFSIRGGTYSNVGDSISAIDALLGNYDTRITQLEGNVGGGSTIPTGTGNGLAIGTGSHAEDATDTAIGTGATVTADNSVALGAGSVANEANTVSVGSAGNERRVTNVAAGTRATDAANVQQMQAGDAATLQAANTYTDTRLHTLDSQMSQLQSDVWNRLGEQDQRIDRKGAMGAAMMNMAINAAGARSRTRPRGGRRRLAERRERAVRRLLQGVRPRDLQPRRRLHQRRPVGWCRLRHRPLSTDRMITQMQNTTRTLLACALGAALLASLTVSAAGNGVAPPMRKFTLPKPAAETSFDRFIVKTRDGIATRSASPSLDAVNAAVARAGVGGITTAANNGATLKVERVRRMAVGADVFRFSRKLTRTEADAVLAQLRKDATVQYAQPDYRKQRVDFTPNDTRFNLQWEYTHPTTGIHAPTAWDIARGAGVVVAVIDTGYLDHSDLAANIVPGYDFIADVQVAGDGDGRDADAHDPGDWIGGDPSSFHGTHVAGTVAAVGNNALGIAGVAFAAKVQPVRVLGHGGGYTSDIADAITWASGGTVAGVPANATPAEVLNLSLGGQGMCSDDPATQAAIDGANARGVTVVVASGNSNADAANHSPASCKGVITVGATGVDGARSYYSNFGPTVAISAPGGNASSGSDADDRWIWSLGNSGMQAPDPSPAGDRLDRHDRHVDGQSARRGHRRADAERGGRRRSLAADADAGEASAAVDGDAVHHRAAVQPVAGPGHRECRGGRARGDVADSRRQRHGDRQSHRDFDERHRWRCEVVQDRRARGQDEREPAYFRRHRQRVVVRRARSRADDGEFRSQLGQARQQRNGAAHQSGARDVLPARRR